MSFAVLRTAVVAASQSLSVVRVCAYIITWYIQQYCCINIINVESLLGVLSLLLVLKSNPASI